MQQHDAALRDAASGLAVVLESEESRTSTAATLWQAYLYHRRDRVKRALDLLPMVLKPLEDEGADGLYARLLRCRCIAELQGEYAVAIALLTRMEAQPGDWFGDGMQERQSRNTIALVRRQIAQQWASVFRESKKNAQAIWCDRAIIRIDANYFSNDLPADLLRLELAIPPIVELPSADH